MSWLIDRSGTHSGTLSPAWTAHTANSLTAWIATTNASFQHTPHYFTTFVSSNTYWPVTGSHHVYDASAKGFRLYILSEDKTGASRVQGLGGVLSRGTQCA